MEVSRGTVQRLLANARGKVAQAIVGQNALAVSCTMPTEEKIPVSRDYVAPPGFVITAS